MWRQGNLLHFGFEQSPTEMNDTGRQLLLNSVAYISRFSEDRPIAITPSVFVQPTARTRGTVLRWLRNPNYELDMAKYVLAPTTWEELAVLPDRDAMIAWAVENAPYLYPGADAKLSRDEDAVALGLPFDHPDFIARAVAALKSGEEVEQAVAEGLLKRYVPCGPTGDDHKAWTEWLEENRPYLFPSDAGDYRWYVDPLAKRRGIPSAELRGPRRADAE